MRQERQAGESKGQFEGLKLWKKDAGRQEAIEETKEEKQTLSNLSP